MAEPSKRLPIDALRQRVVVHSCTIGNQLQVEYQNAAKGRADARINLLLSCQNMAQCEALVQVADERRDYASGAYHLHNAFCLFCKANPSKYA